MRHGARLDPVKRGLYALSARSPVLGELGWRLHDAIDLAFWRVWWWLGALGRQALVVWLALVVVSLVLGGRR